jgi:hypothetical protein
MRAATKAMKLVVLLVAVSFWASPLWSQESCKLTKEYRGGKLYDCGGMRMVVLQGNYREMGRQYGALLKDDIIAFYSQMFDKFIFKSGLFDEGDIPQFVSTSVKTQAKRQSELLKGMAEKTGLSFEKHILINSNMGVLVYLRKMGHGNAGACTSMATWGNYTANRRTYTARNFDFPNIYREVSKNNLEILLVLKPNDGSNYVAGVCYAGMIQFLDAMNDKGLYTENNNGAGSEGLVIYSDRAMILDEVMNMLLDADNIDSFEGRLRTTRSGYPMIFMSAGPDDACYFEAGTTDTKKRVAGEDGLISAANQFLEPSWHITPLKSPAVWYSEARQNALEALAKAHKGRIDEKIMMKIFDERLFNKDGSIGKGASVIEKNPKDDEVTVHQVVTCPSERKMWVRIPTYTDWILFDLNKVFRD